MSATCSDRRLRRPPRGFTMVELIVVLVILGVLSAVALPRMGALVAMPNATYREQVLQSLLHARTAAQAHRRLVCVNIAAGGVTLSGASLFGDATCTVAYTGSDGDARFAVDRSSMAVTLTNAGTLYFQPDGRISRDAAGAQPWNGTVTVGSEAPITLAGRTGAIQ